MIASNQKGVIYMIDRNLIFHCEQYMLDCLKNDMAHDPQHMYRVLKLAMDIADHEENVNRDILVVACCTTSDGRLRGKIPRCVMRRSAERWPINF